MDQAAFGLSLPTKVLLVLRLPGQTSRDPDHVAGWYVYAPQQYLPLYLRHQHWDIHKLRGPAPETR